MRLGLTRTALAALGVAIGGYGVWLLVSRQPPGRLLDVGEWFAAGIVLHDAVLAPVVVVAGWHAARRLPRTLRLGGVIVLVLLGPVTLVAVPVLGRFGADPSNPTLDGRDYAHGWLLVAATTALLAAGAATMSTLLDHRRRRRADVPGPGRR